MHKQRQLSTHTGPINSGEVPSVKFADEPAINPDEKHIFAEPVKKSDGSKKSSTNLDSAIFRIINERLYTSDSQTAAHMLSKDEKTFRFVVLQLMYEVFLC